MNPMIVLYDALTSTVSIAVRFGCSTVDDTATLSVWPAECPKVCEKWVDAGCGFQRLVVEPLPTVKTAATYLGTTSDKMAKFRLPEIMHTSDQIYWHGELERCGRKIKVRFQRRTQTGATYETSIVNGCADWIVDSEVIGKVATIREGCLVPSGWAEMRNCDTGALIGYAPMYKGGGFCIPYQKTCYGCEQVYLASECSLDL